MEKVENDISHQLIEEFMLAANEVVAREIKNKQLSAIYRIHEDPDADKLAEYREFVKSYGLKAGDLTQRREVQKLLAAIRGRPEEYALKLGFLKSLKRATYDTNPVGHYGLAKTNYTHFTSPIRRYADLVVHRVLSHATNHHSVKGVRLAAADLAATCAHISTTERTAADAEKESVKFKKIEFFQNQLKQQRPPSYSSVIVDVRNYGLLVELPDLLLTGMVHVSALAGDFFTFDSVRLRFVGRRTKKTYQIGDKLNVAVARVDVYKQQVDFHPA
jgi:ribonuclease R